MADRTYTVAELMGMREAIQYIGAHTPITMSAAVVEDQLRTYMANGTEPAELVATASEMRAAEGRTNEVGG